METLLMIPLSVTLIIVTLTLNATWLGLKLNHMRNKMRWWRNEAMMLNGNNRYLREKDKPYYKNKVRAWWLRKQ